MAETLRHRQTKEAATDMFSLQPPRHIPTLPNSAIGLCDRHRGTCFDSGRHGSLAPIAGGAVGSPRQDYPRNRTRRPAAVATGMGHNRTLMPQSIERAHDTKALIAR
jgi:hypothetical protein